MATRLDMDDPVVRVVAALADVWAVVDAAGLTHDWHGRSEALFGCSPMALEGRSLGSLLVPGPVSPDLETLPRTADGGHAWQRALFRTQSHDGHSHSVEATLFEHRAAHLLFLRAASADARIAEALVEASVNEIYVIDATTRRFVVVNPSARKNLGFTMAELVAMTPAEIRGDTDRPALGQVLGPLIRGEIDRLRFRSEHRRKDGSSYPIDLDLQLMQLDGRPHVLAIGLDRSEQRALEAQLLHAQKLEAVGRLAGGVAHDFNNALTAILGNAELARLALDNPEFAGESIDLVIDAAQGAADTTRQLLSFARRQIIKPVAFDPRERLRGVGRLLQPVLGEDVSLAVHVEATDAVIRMDPGQFEQLLMNLAVNARDAMPRGGKLTLECCVVELDSEYARRHGGVEPGRYVQLAVTDTGMGMDPDTQSRIFEPFFTTKEVGRGTGLGLASCHGIVKQNGGHIWVYSELGKGTTFKIYLPASGVADHLAPPTIAPKDLSGNEHILVAEDDARVRALCTAALSQLGYRVVAVTTGKEALAAADGAPLLDVLITDVVLPDMRGPDVARAVSINHPKCIVLYASGYTENSIVHDGVLEAGVEFLPKPYTPSQLAQTVRGLLDGRRSDL